MTIDVARTATTGPPSVRPGTVAGTVAAAIVTVIATTRGIVVGGRIGTGETT
jgi:hypothetical protein